MLASTLPVEALFRPGLAETGTVVLLDDVLVADVDVVAAAVLSVVTACPLLTTVRVAAT